MRTRTLLLLALVCILAVALYFVRRKPAAAPPRSVKVAMTPERIARGKYLFEYACDCNGCHSERDFSRFGGPVVASGRGKGTVMPPELGLPGRVAAPNITPDPETGLGRWTDGEKIRAIREGVSRDGRALFPMMPYTFFRLMSDEDVESLVAYMNTLAPVRNALPATSLQFPVSFLIKSVPQPVGAIPQPDHSDRVRYGEYLATLAACADCHTQEKRGKPLAGMAFAGGRRFSFPQGVAVVSANITPDLATGIGKWTEQQFVDKFYEYQEYSLKGSPPAGPEAFTLMPWLAFSNLAPEDLGAIYAYLRTVPPVRNAVETHMKAASRARI